MVERILPFMGAARCSRHNFVFLEGVKAALTADAVYDYGWYKEPPRRGLRAAARVYAGWGFSQTFYRKKLDLELPKRPFGGKAADVPWGYSSLEDFLVYFWEGFFLAKDANNLLSLLWTWQYGDISGNPKYGGNFEKALGAIKAKAIVMPASTDLYFPPGGQRIRSQAHAERRIARLSRAIGDTSPAILAAPAPTSRLSTRRSRNCWQADTEHSDYPTGGK